MKELAGVTIIGVCLGMAGFLTWFCRNGVAKRRMDNFDPLWLDIFGRLVLGAMVLGMAAGFVLGALATIASALKTSFADEWPYVYIVAVLVLLVPTLWPTRWTIHHPAKA